MNEHVQGVKLRFELPFKLPAPVSFPFESIGDFRPISRIPKYDFSLEKKIMKEISKQKQEDQFNMLRQAQQQLSMVDLIASRKNRHKGKEPERASQAAAAAAASSSVTSTLTKPRSDSGVTRPQSAAATGVYASTDAAKRKQAESSTPLQPQPKPQKPAQALDGPPAHFGAGTSPAGTIAAVQGSQVERPHSAEPALTTTQPTAAVRPMQPAISQQFVASTTAATYRPMYQPVGNSMPTSTASMAGGPSNFHQTAVIRPQGNTQQPQPQLQAAGMYRPGASAALSMYPSPNFSTGYPVQSSVGQQASLSAISSSGGLGSMLGPGMNNAAPRPILQQQLQPQMQPVSQPRPQFQTHLQIPPPSPQQQLQYSQPGIPMATPQQTNVPRIEPKPNQISSSFGSHPSWTQDAPPSQSGAVSRPALPPKPDEWKLGASAQPPSLLSGEPVQSPSASSSGPLPLPPRRNVNQSDPAAPAIPPKPFTSFSEFDYARDEPSGASNSEQSSGHVEQVSTLVSMGFSRPQALQALEMYDYDVNKASNYLIDKAF
ncbi:hypothetical protein GGI19_001059 [Coemansia pectinata]|uniref:UBA domain-containing protein n=1 Tax=Coemansia pectinata TaxID=1052879 RepID=A0A9W8LDK1_9FUNG|nr:hypothetical protein GGI19_001059 [Coemansia pectinata]